MIKSVKFVNFKSLSPQTVELGPLNVLIGANASGKSNFVDAFRFIRDCVWHGASAAVAKRRGWKNVVSARPSQPPRIRLGLLMRPEGIPHLRRQGEEYTASEASYSLEIGCTGAEPRVWDETFRTLYTRDAKTLEDGFVRRRGSLKGLGDAAPARAGFLRGVLKGFARDRSYLPMGFPAFSSYSIAQSLGRWRFYELDPNAARSPSTEEAPDVLSEDGANLARVLKALQRADRETSVRVRKLMNILVPGFSSWGTRRRADGTVVFTVKEDGIARPFLPSSISDGTIRLLCMLLGVLHTHATAPLMSIDEPERCLHPQLFKTLVELIREASHKTQMLVTTHSAELVRWLQPSEVLLVDKKDNQTVIVRAKDVEHIEEFLKEFRLDELWLQGYLKGGTAL